MKNKAQIEAQRLVNLYSRVGLQVRQEGKECALISIGEQMKQAEELFHKYGIGYMGVADARNDVTKWKHYQDLQEIEKKIASL